MSDGTEMYMSLKSKECPYLIVQCYTQKLIVALTLGDEWLPFFSDAMPKASSGIKDTSISP